MGPVDPEAPEGPVDVGPVDPEISEGPVGPEGAEGPVGPVVSIYIKNIRPRLGGATQQKVTCRMTDQP